MDAFFVEAHQWVHPYPLRFWCTATEANTAFLLTYDGVKLRLYNFCKHNLIKEIDYLSHDSLSAAVGVYHPDYPSRAIFVVVKDRRTLIAYDEDLKPIASLQFDTSLIVLSMVWCAKRRVLYVAGNFGWLRALQLNITVSLSGTVASWVPLWTKHDSGQWMQHLTIDDHRNILFGVSGVEVFLWNMDDGQLITQFDSKHTMAISEIKYCPEHIIFFTASADGTVKTWRFFDKKPTELSMIKQIALGPMMLASDSNTLITMSHERVLRRYNTMSGNVIGELDLDIATPIEIKNVETPLFMELAFTNSGKNKEEWLFTSEDNKLRLFEVHYAPRELGVACDFVKDVVVDRSGCIYVLCRNNIVHTMYTNGQEGRTYDLDTMEIANLDGEKNSVSYVTLMRIHDNKVYFGFERGDIRVLDIDKQELYEMNESDRDNQVAWMCPVKELLTIRHIHCSVTKHVEEVLLSGAECTIQIHCPLCYNFIASWRLQNKKILQIEQVPGENMLIVLDEEHLRLYGPADSMLMQLAYIEFEQFEVGQKFVFASENYILVGMTSGRSYVYVVNPQTKKIIHLHTINTHNSPVVKMLPCRDLRRIDECRDIVERENLNGVVCSIGEDNSLAIIDCFTGFILWRTNLPFHKHGISAAFTYKAKIMLVVSIDQNIRLFDWPTFERAQPTPVTTTRSESHEDVTVQSPYKNPFRDADEEEEMEFLGIPHTKTEQKLNNIKPKDPSIWDVKVEMDHDRGISEEYRAYYKTCLSNPKRTKVELVMENRLPKIRFRDIDDEDTVPVPMPTPTPPEIEINDDLFLMDLIQPPPKTIDMKAAFNETLQRNMKILEDLMLEDPETAEAFRTKRVKKIRALRPDEVEEDSFYDYFMAVDVQHVPTKRAQTAVAQPEERKRRILENPERIKKIGFRKERPKNTKKHYLIIEFENGQKMKTSEITLSILNQIAKAQAKPDDELSGLTPGWVFQKAFNDLEKARKRTRSRVIIQEQELLALPIMTLTDAGCSIGANYHRFFNNKPYKKFVNDTIGSFVTTTHDGTESVTKNPFMHWEGVNFDPRSFNNGVIGISQNYEEIPIEYPEDIDDDDEDMNQYGGSLISEIMDRTRKKRSKTVTSARKGEAAGGEEDTFGELMISEAGKTGPRSPTNPFNPFGGFPGAGKSAGFNLFERKDSTTNAIVDSSPSLRAISDMLGNEDNPILALIQNSPAYTPEQIREQLDQERRQTISMWQHPSPGSGSLLIDTDGPPFNNKFSFEGLGHFDVSQSRNRPGSPRAMNVFTELTQRMQFEGISELPAILEEGSEGFEDEPDYEEAEDEADLGESPFFAQQRAKSMSFIQEHLERNDFRSLRELLENVGLFDNEDGLADLPRWQPIVNFNVHHQGASRFIRDPNQVVEEEEIFEEEEEENIGLQEERIVSSRSKEASEEVSHTEATSEKPQETGCTPPETTKISSREKDFDTPKATAVSTSRSQGAPELGELEFTCNRIPTGKSLSARFTEYEEDAHIHFDVPERLTESDHVIYNYEEEEEEEEEEEVYEEEVLETAEDGSTVVKVVTTVVQKPKAWKKVPLREGVSKFQRREGHKFDDGLARNLGKYKKDDGDPLRAKEEELRKRREEALRAKKMKLIMDPKEKNRRKMIEMLPGDHAFEHKTIDDLRQQGDNQDYIEKHRQAQRRRRAQAEKDLTLERKEEPPEKPKRHKKKSKKKKPKNKLSSSKGKNDSFKDVDTLYNELIERVKLKRDSIHRSQSFSNLLAVPPLIPPEEEKEPEHESADDAVESEYEYSEEEEEIQEEEEPEPVVMKSGFRIKAPRTYVPTRAKQGTAEQQDGRGVDTTDQEQTPERSDRLVKRQRQEIEIVFDEIKRKPNPKPRESPAKAHQSPAQSPEPLFILKGKPRTQHRRTLGRRKSVKPEEVEEEPQTQAEELPPEQKEEAAPEEVPDKQDDWKQARLNRRRRRRISSKLVVDKDAVTRELTRKARSYAEDESQLLDKLMQQTTDAVQLVEFEDLSGDTSSIKKLYRTASQVVKERSTSLGTEKMKLSRLGPSMKLKSLQRCKAKTKTTELLGMKLRFKIRGKSVDSKRPEFQRKQMHMFGLVEIAQAPKIFMTYDSPTIWSSKTGKVRRNSFG